MAEVLNFFFYFFIKTFVVYHGGDWDTGELRIS
jgi:hypothetical protein